MAIGDWEKQAEASVFPIANHDPNKKARIT
ncbi:hypothetical protein STPYR_10258 [uncultured Stenotrophomonas sp.]|uniref:Uncharacterized protein n=1 Tax=uncultured Stenotrophomonas sp. TaxID=165438 RepID=A0A1Y5PZ70_9GAMM|nr:hypothetical protein STPYR_10258 [uncultured Stenotrophomonas sp.]